MEELKKLDEKGFVFLDRLRRPYLCKMYLDEPWLFFWHHEKHWVSLRPVDQTEIWSFPKNLSQEKQDLYHKQHKAWEESQIF